jgi:hypothetical protein
MKCEAISTAIFINHHQFHLTSTIIPSKSASKRVGISFLKILSVSSHIIEIFIYHILFSHTVNISVVNEGTFTLSLITDSSKISLSSQVITLSIVKTTEVHLGPLILATLSSNDSSFTYSPSTFTIRSNGKTQALYAGASFINSSINI